MKLDLTVHILGEGNHYVAHVLPLDVMSGGPAPQAAREALDEAVRCFVKTAADAGTLETILEESGYRQQNGIWTGPDWIGVERHVVDV